MSRTLTMITLAAIILLGGCSKSGQTNRNASASANASDASRNASAQSSGELPPMPGDTPLMTAVKTRNTEEVRQLLDNNASVDAASDTGVTPLMNAVGMGQKEVAEMLISKGANVNWRAPGNYTILMAAAINGQTEMVRMLLEKGADPKVKDLAGKTAARYADEQKHKETVELLNKWK
jgi:uncharacterized protein